MKIVSQVYPVGCPCCGNRTLQAIPTKRDGEMKFKPSQCPKCKKTVTLIPIGTTEAFGESGEFTKVTYTHRMVQKALLRWEAEEIKEGESSKPVPLSSTTRPMLTIPIVGTPLL